VPHISTERTDSMDFEEAEHSRVEHIGSELMVMQMARDLIVALQFKL
jgi:hypothetical protein